jgi:hypothetical protein
MKEQIKIEQISSADEIGESIRAADKLFITREIVEEKTRSRA